MKKYFMIAAAALLIASCAKESDALYEDAAQSGEVTFTAFAKNAVKGYVTNTQLAKLKFEDLRKDASGNVSSADASTDPREMHLSVYNEEAECDLFVDVTYQREADGQWHATPSHKFYPIGYKDFDFLAYSLDEKSFKNVSWNGAKEVKLEVTDDFLTEDILYAGGKEAAATHGPAYMLFKHAQAWITVRFTVDASSDAYKQGGAKDADGNTILAINGAEWQNIYKSGELTLKWLKTSPTEDEIASASPTSADKSNYKADAEAKWNFFTQEPSNVVMPDRETDATYGYPVATKDYLVKNSYLDMLIPQQDKQALVINYTLGGEKFSYTIGMDKIGTGIWEMGKHYIYNIEFAITEITTAPAVKVWAEQTAIGIDL